MQRSSISHQNSVGAKWLCTVEEWFKSGSGVCDYVALKTVQTVPTVAIACASWGASGPLCGTPCYGGYWP